MRHSLFTYCKLLGFAHNTWFEGISDLDTEGFSGDVGDGLGRMSKFKCRLLMLFLHGAIAGCALLLVVSRKNSTQAITLS